MNGTGYRWAAIAAGAAALVILAGCSGGSGKPSPTRGGGVTPPVTVVTAGDIAACDSSGDEQTAALVARYPTAQVLTLGDSVYPDGTAEQFAQCFAPSWGVYKARTRPSPGNHDYNKPGAAGYFGYFSVQPWYAFNLGSWRLYSLNSEQVTSDQVAWLTADLAANPRACVLAYWHRARYSDGPHGDSWQVDPLWRELVARRADVVLAGHDHNYQRFGLIDGIRSFVVGTGGNGHWPPPTSSRLQATYDGYGVLVLTLGSGFARWQFVAVNGSVRDSGSASCRP